MQIRVCKGIYLDSFFFTYSYTKSIDIFWICIHRDWRDSNPQLPPWQGGALTNWTTIPGKKSYSIHTDSYNFIQTLCFSIWDLNPCKRGRLLYIFLFLWVCALSTRMTRNPFVIANLIQKSMNQGNKKDSFLTLTLSLDFLLTDPDRSFAKSEFVEKICK